MKPLRNRLQEARARLGIPWEVLERDYILSWILAGICKVDTLRGTLVFKGGTALKKCYFGDYRFSEDLDFSAVGDVPTGEAMEKAIRQACAGNLRGTDGPLRLRVLPAREVRHPERGVQRTGRFLSGNHARLRREDLGPVAWPAHARASLLRDRDRQATPTDHRTHSR